MFLHLSYTSELAPRGVGRLGRLHASGAKALRQHVQVGVDFLVGLLIEPAPV